MLAKIGITIGKGNKLELDEDALKQAYISSLKTVFTGYNSFGKQNIAESNWYIECCKPGRVQPIQIMVRTLRRILFGHRAR